MDGWLVGRWMGGWTDGGGVWLVIGRLSYRRMDKQTALWTNKVSDGRRDRQSNGRTYRQTKLWTDGQAD